MTESSHSWSPDWIERLRKEVLALGFADLTQLLASMPARPYSEVANYLGQIAPIQLIAVQFREAKAAARLRDAVKDSLCRNLAEQLPGGWGVGEKSEWQVVRALSGWSSEIQVTGECQELRAKLLSIASALRNLPPPQEWIPAGPNDSIIEAVFDLHWPNNE
jgi:hypothetical protein